MHTDHLLVPVNRVNKKREYKNAKFGFGGKTRRMKFNDRQSNNAEDDGFDAKRNNKTFSKQKVITWLAFYNINCSDCSLVEHTVPLVMGVVDMVLCVIMVVRSCNISLRVIRMNTWKFGKCPPPTTPSCTLSKKKLQCRRWHQQQKAVLLTVFRYIWKCTSSMAIIYLLVFLPWVTFSVLMNFFSLIIVEFK